MLLLLALPLLLTTLAEAGCPDQLAMRSSSVNSSFNPQQLTGFWYEQAFADIAQVHPAVQPAVQPAEHEWRCQVGASCPTLNSTKAADDVVTMDLAVQYGRLPFTITELYTPKGER